MGWFKKGMPLIAVFIFFFLYFFYSSILFNGGAEPLLSMFLERKLP